MHGGAGAVPARYNLTHPHQAGLAHAQLETIHPFLNGNGQLERLLVSFVLRHEGVLDEVTGKRRNRVFANSASLRLLSKGTEPMLADA